jgi:hypothetical protein
MGAVVSANSVVQPDAGDEDEDGDDFDPTTT